LEIYSAISRLIAKVPKDLLNGITALMESDYKMPVNVGNDEEFTILELAEKIIQLTNSDSKIIHKPLPSDDPIKRKPDLTLVKKELGYKPAIKLEDGLVKTIEYFRRIDNTINL